MKSTVLITGASSGIGRELAVLCARDGMELVLVARRKDRLEELSSQLSRDHGVTVRIVARDLCAPNAPEALYDALAEVPIDVLFNNAGFGAKGAFSEIDVQLQLDMLQLNVVALTHLTRLFVPAMLQRGRGRILNVASAAAFPPGPYMAVYYATKAYVLSFSEALAEELRGSGVSVTALCPGPTVTEFQARARMEGSRLRHLGMMSAREVAEQGYRAMMRGKSLVITGLTNRFVVQSIRFSPRWLVRRVTGWLNS